ncbi:MAG TPA: sialidase family protein [Herpetosiphonaceae bacterium]
MSALSKRFALFRVLIAIALIATVAGVAFAFEPVRELASLESDMPVEEEGPVALSRHIEKIREAVPGNGGEATEGPGFAADYAFFQRAYPDTAIPLSRLEKARGDFNKKKLKGNPGQDKKGVWQPVGPSIARYQKTDLRTSYVPNEYIAGGRTTAIEISPNCTPSGCRMWIAASGGGIWRTENALAASPKWKFLTGDYAINAAGSIALDPNDPSGNTLWVGTGESNACASGCVAGVGLYRSKNGGNTWEGPIGAAEFAGKGVGSIAIKPGDPNTIYAASTTALRGATSVCCGGVTRPVPGAAKWGLYKSTDGGLTWSFIHNGSTDPNQCTGTDTEYNNAGVCSPRGTRRVAIDPSNADIVYAASFGRGVWRSNDAGATWVQIKAPLNTIATDRAEFAVTKLANGKTRMYVGDGASGTPAASFFRSDDVATGTPTFQNLTTYANSAYCGGQCWYDNYVYTPAGYPDVVYLSGSHAYGETRSNGRAVVLSTDAGVSFTDMTEDATDPVQPNGLHPDHHALVTQPGNPYVFFDAGDGGIMRSSGQFADISADCSTRGLSATNLARCRQMLSRIPTLLSSVNEGLSTLQFQSISVNPFDVTNLQGGTQDNGSWETKGSKVEWLETMWGDGGQSGFDVADPNFRFHTYYGPSPDVNFNAGAIEDWIWVADPIYTPYALGIEASGFYPPLISDPKVSGTMFAGLESVYRTKTHGLGTMTMEEAQQHCNTHTGDFAVTCGDWVPLGSARLTAASYGDRQGGHLAAVERAPSNTSTLWAATTTGRVFISQNADAEPAGSVSFTRIDVPTAPNRFISSIYIDPANPNHAWISYSGFNSATPAAPGHIFEVTFNPATGTATWTSLDADFGDMPVTDLVRDDMTGTLYAASDFGVFKRVAGSNEWTMAAPGMPQVEVPGLTIVPSERKLYAATHGLSAWSLTLP